MSRDNDHLLHRGHMSPLVLQDLQRFVCQAQAMHTEEAKICLQEKMAKHCGEQEGLLPWATSALTEFTQTTGQLSQRRSCSTVT